MEWECVLERRKHSSILSMAGPQSPLGPLPYQALVERMFVNKWVFWDRQGFTWKHSPGLRVEEEVIFWDKEACMLLLQGGGCGRGAASSLRNLVTLMLNSFGGRFSQGWCKSYQLWGN